MLVAAALAGCGDEPSADSGRPAGGDRAKVGWQDARVIRDGRALELVYATAPCYLPIERAVVERRPERLVVTLVGQVPPDVCRESASIGCVRVRLAASLGDREVVDGAGGDDGPALPEGMLERARDCRAVPSTAE